MIPIPRKSTADAQRMMKVHKECIDSMKGVAGNTVLKCATPGDTTTVTGGIHEDFQLACYFACAPSRPRASW
jgi:hypothetical protein